MANHRPSGSRRAPRPSGSRRRPRPSYCRPPRPDVEQDAGVPVPDSDPRGEDRERHPGRRTGGHLGAPGCSPGRRTGMLPGMANGNSTSAYRSGCVGDAGTCTRPPPAPGHRPVRVRRAGRRRTGTPSSCRGAPAPSSCSGTPTSSCPRSSPGDEYWRTMSRRGTAMSYVTSFPPGGSEGGTVRRGGPRGGWWGQRFAWDGPPSGDIARRYRRLVPRGRSAGSSASGDRSGCVGDAGTCTRPPPAPGHRPRGPGEPPWLPRGARSTNGGGRRAPRCPTGPRLEELVPGAAGEPLGEETPLSPGSARRPGVPVRLPVRRRGRGRGSPRTSSRRGGRGEALLFLEPASRFRDVLHQVWVQGRRTGMLPGAAYRTPPVEPGSERVEDGGLLGIEFIALGARGLLGSQFEPSPGMTPEARPVLLHRVGSRRAGDRGAPAARWDRWSRRPRGPVMPKGPRGPPEGLRGPAASRGAARAWEAPEGTSGKRVRGSSASGCSCNIN